MKHGALLLLVFATGGCGAGSADSGADLPPTPAKPSPGGMSGAAGASAVPAASSANAVVAPVSLARRLSQSELDNTLADTLGDSTRPGTRLLIEDEFRPYDNDYTVQRASQAYSDAMRELAKDVSRRFVSDAARRMAFLPCQPTAAGDAICFRKVIETLGLRLLRRPLAPAEVDAYMALQKFATENNPVVMPNFYTGVELVLRAFLQDPEFQHRVEIGKPTATPAVVALDSFETAARMSYFLWGSAPDDALLAAAQKGGLLTADSRGAEADRLLADKRTRARVARFHAQWLGYRAIPHPAALTAQFNAETTKLIETVIFDSPSSYFDLFTSNRTYLTPELATHYKLPVPMGAANWVNYGDTGRAGILSHGSVLAGFSKFSDTSPTQRGIFVQTRLLCNQILPPPANVDVDQPPGDKDNACKTQRYMAHESLSGCKSCHVLIDPIGHGLEKYDVAGRVRMTDDGKPQCKIPGIGQIPELGQFSGPKEIAEKLLAAGEIQDCVIRQGLVFALGRSLAAEDEPLVDKFRMGMAAGGNKFLGFLRQVVTDPSFALKRVPQ